MHGSNFFIKKGSILAYRLYDIAHEIDLKVAKSQLESAQTLQNLRRYKLQKDPLRTVTLREAPLIFSLSDESIEIQIPETKEIKSFKTQVEVKIWDYGVLSLRFKIDLPSDLSWQDLVTLGSIIDSDSIIDVSSIKKRDDIILNLKSALKSPQTQTVFEDYTTYLIEELEEVVKDKSKQELSDDQENATSNRVKVKDPLEILKRCPIPELLLAEPKKTLAESTKNSIRSNFSQYTKKDLLVLDWNSALVMDFSKEKEKEYQDYVDIIEFSLAQLLELRIYDQLIDEKLNKLYDAMENNQHTKITDFYSAMGEESGLLYMEFSDVFEKLDNSIKTIGDFYLAKVLRSADKKFGFDELKRTMSRKIEALRELSSMYQKKIDSLVEEKRNNIAANHTKVSHRMEIAVVVLILIEAMPSIEAHFPWIFTFFKLIKNFVTDIL
jgi:hypothetical protein